MTDAALIQLQAQERRRADPLEYWRASSMGQDYALRAACSGLWVYAHSGNRSGKTEVGAAMVDSMLTGREGLGGYHGSAPVKVPLIRPPVVGAVLGITYKLMASASIAAIRSMLGAWDYREEHAGSPDNVSLFRVRHRLAQDESEWSKLYVYPYDGPVPEGPGLDFWWCDEPAPERFLTALRSRFRAGRSMYRIITATPRRKLEWFPILSQFPSRERVVENGRVRVQWPVYDNEALTEPTRDALIAEAQGDEYARAIIYGDHVDLTESNPFRQDILMRWLARCRDPEVERLIVQAERFDKTGRIVTEIGCDLERWADWDSQQQYAIFLDPARGMDHERKTHDPDCAHVWSVTRNALVARVNQYLGGWGLGMLGERLSADYGGAVVFPMMGGGYGDQVLTGLRMAGCHNIGRERYFDRTSGEWSERFGIAESESSRNAAVAALERAMLTDACGIWSKAVVECLMSVVKNERDKVVAPPWGHDEDLILAGNAQVIIGRIRGSQPYQEPKPDFLEVVRREMGRSIEQNGYETPIVEAW